MNGHISCKRRSGYNHGCYEARKEKYREKVWTVESEPWDLCGSEVVRLEGYGGGFATEYLKRVET
ncbi:hypothetical protein QOZ95_004541 [Paenibacillus brasilensis]|uniref:Uncharacterized protein n=1 Tax=Paenibacillus brasilensis TaxID=128574 RepID=A0ABU0L516_9BACL|nr:hypothetical protein [Paenibacillus brasilensis]